MQSLKKDGRRRPLLSGISYIDAIRPYFDAGLFGMRRVLPDFDEPREDLDLASAENDALLGENDALLGRFDSR